MSEIETFGVTLPVRTWQELFALSELTDRQPSDYLRILIQEQAAKLLTPGKPTPRPEGERSPALSVREGAGGAA
jgi:hypothetical protein